MTKRGMFWKENCISATPTELKLRAQELPFSFPPAKRTRTTSRPEHVTVEAFPTEASALKAAKALRIDANQQTPHSEGGPETVAELVAHYRLKELVGEN